MSNKKRTGPSDERYFIRRKASSLSDINKRKAFARHKKAHPTDSTVLGAVPSYLPSTDANRS